MLKVKNITLSGFRGILTEQKLSLLNGNAPSSLVVYGLNSTGKTSFVDGLEWFLSPDNQIEWLKRENAGGHSYPHQEAADDETYVEIEFSNKQYGSLRKTFNQNRITKPTLSDESKFIELYKDFIIRPYLRYLEIIDFVFNRTGVEKYQKLANWMGFEDELAFQEKLALEILTKLKTEEGELSKQITYIDDEIKKLSGLDEVSNELLIIFCNKLLNGIGFNSIKKLDNLEGVINKLDKKRTGKNDREIEIITKTQTALEIFKSNEQLEEKLILLSQHLDEFTKKKELAEKIDYINLYEKAYSILQDKTDDFVLCPVCNTKWEKDKLINHIKEELKLLKDIKDQHDQILEEISNAKSELVNEISAITNVESSLKSVDEIGIQIKKVKLTVYKKALTDLLESFGSTIFETEIELEKFGNKQKNASKEIEAIINLLKKEKKKLQLTKKEILLNEAIEKLKLLHDKLNRKLEIVEKHDFYSQEIDKVSAISNEFFRLVQENITKRFDDISSTIERYFQILRQDKDIKDIEITLNLEKSRAVGRSAEIQLTYYNLSVKPAYKVLSESLLNSLGLAVYFTCIKKFNSNSKFIVLDDVMNSLDIGHRDTLLDLIEEEFSDYQIILFTHDMHWFERIQRRFPKWLHKKIKTWDYYTGPKIDYSIDTINEIKDLLKDSTKADTAGRSFGVYAENVLNELCEKLQAKLRYRYTKADPPSTDELFTALISRLQEKLKNHPVAEAAKNAYKYEPLIRNATSHSRQNYSSQISPTEVQRALDEWLKLQQLLWCDSCNKFVEYIQKGEKFECHCGKLELKKVN